MEENTYLPECKFINWNNFGAGICNKCKKRRQIYYVRLEFANGDSKKPYPKRRLSPVLLCYGCTRDREISQKSMQDMVRQSKMRVTEGFDEDLLERALKWYEKRVLRRRRAHIEVSPYARGAAKALRALGAKLRHIPENQKKSKRTKKNAKNT